VRRAFVVGCVLSLLLFVLLAVAVQLRWLAAVDLAVTVGVQPLAGPGLNRASIAIGVLLSSEASVGWGLALAVVLWRRGAGVWALAPLGFAAPVLLEAGLKYVIHQPPPPPDFYRDVAYPLATVNTPGSFPSGHVIRAAWFGGFLAVLARARGWRLGTIAPYGLALLVAFIAFTRVYLGDHWTSDVVAGVALGAPLGVVTAELVVLTFARPLGTVQRPCDSSQTLPADHPRTQEPRPEDKVSERRARRSGDG
jgi:undecaprenyl-diphosphatase